jgi:Mn-dependent DtxR family transcriptional regulator
MKTLGTNALSAARGRSVNFALGANETMQKRKNLSPKRKWAASEDDLLRKTYNKVSVDWLSETLGRTVNSIRIRAKRLGLTVRQPYPARRDWACPKTKGDAYIKQNYALCTIEELAAALGVSRATVSKRARLLGVRKINTNNFLKWTKDDDEFLRKNFKKMKLLELAAYFGIGIGLVSYRARRLGLRKVNSSIWNEHNDEILKNNYATLPVKELAAFFEVSEQVVRKRERKLGLKRPKFFQLKKVKYFCPQCKTFVLGKPGLSIVCSACGEEYQPNVSPIDLP